MQRVKAEGELECIYLDSSANIKMKSEESLWFLRIFNVCDYKCVLGNNVLAIDWSEVDFF